MPLQDFNIHTLHLFPEVDTLLISCLRSCSTQDWGKETIAGKWTVKDIAAHLLDVTLRALSAARDGYAMPESPVINSYRDLVNYLNELNADWVKSFKRVSPSLLIQCLELANNAYYEFSLTLDLSAPAIYSVAWAGETVSTNRFHIAREYTEKWHHQQQIRTALGLTAPLMQRHLFQPCIGTFLHGLPYAYRNLNSMPGTIIQVTIPTEAGGDWQLERNLEGWIVKQDEFSAPTTQLILQPETAWKLFTRGISGEAARKMVRISGDETLAEPLFGYLAVMA